MLADTNEATYGDQSDRWWCSAYLDHTDWTPAVSTQCTTGRLVDAPGPIRAMRTFGSGYVAYKDKAIFVGRYVGAPAVWDWDKVPGEIGTFSQDCVVNIGSAHAFIGQDDFYLFDGARPVPIGGPIREWFFSTFDISKGYRAIGTYNHSTGNIWWWYCSKSTSGSDPDQAVIYNVRSQKWGKYSKTVEAVSVYYSSGVTYEGLGTLYSTYEDLPTDISYDSPYWTAANPVLAIIETDHILYTLTGTAGNTSLTAHNIGDEQQFSTISRVIPRFHVEPSSSSIEYSYDNTHGDGFTLLNTYTYADGRYDLMNSARWHSVTLNFSGNIEILGIDPQLIPDGTE